MNRRRAVLASAAAAAITVGVLVTPAAARRDGVLRADGLVPGSSASTTFEVRNGSRLPADVQLRVTGLVSDEGECLRPERREPGEECTADGGELEDWLEVTVSEVASEARLWAGTLDQLGAPARITALPGGASRSLRLTVALPASASNATMSDRVTFDTEVGTTTIRSSSAVAGPQVAAGASAAPRTGRPTGTASVLGALDEGPRVTLPMTGASISLWLLLLDALVLAVGAGLVRAARRA